MAYHWHGKEGRWGDRFAVNAPVQLSTERLADAPGCITNLSLSGALVQTDADLGLHSGSEVTVEIASPLPRAKAVTAYVSRKMEEG